MYLVGKISLKTDAISHNGYVELSHRGNIPPPAMVQYKAGLAANHGVGPDDYDVKDVNDFSASDQDRVRAADEFVLVWTGDVITGVSFALEDAKNIVDFTTASNQEEAKISSDGVDTVAVKVKVFEPNGATPLSLNGTEYVAVNSPLGTSVVKLDFTNGVANTNLKSALPGRYRFPVWGAYVDLASSQTRVRKVLTVDAHI